MIEPFDTISLTEFRRNAKRVRRRLKKSGRPAVLTIRGKETVIIQDAVSFARMMREMERARLVLAVKEGISQFEAGRTVPLERVTKQLRAKYQRTPRSK